MKKELILILITTMIAASACSLADEPDSARDKVKTGDIEIKAFGCAPPPYEHGIKLLLCRMPEIKPVEIPDWIGEMPRDAPSARQWHNAIKDSLRSGAKEVLDYIYDSLGISVIVKRPAPQYRDNIIATGITDSMGNFTFEDIPIGRYQLICEKVRPDMQAISVWDTLTEKEEDSLIQFLKEIRNDPDMARPIDTHNSEPEKGLFGETHCVPGVMNYIRVAEDSISLVRTGLFPILPGEDPGLGAAAWLAKFKERGDQDERKKE